MPSLNPVVSNLVVMPIDRTAANPAISIGGDAINNSGTGIYGSIGLLKIAIGGADVLAIDSGGIQNLSVSSVFKPPVYTTIQRDALTPVKGWIIYNSTDDVHQGYNGIWNDLY